MAEYIDRENAIILMKPIIEAENQVYGKASWNFSRKCADCVANMPAADAVPASVYQQAVWERDTALSQLKEIGKGLGEKMDDVVSREEGIKMGASLAAMHGSDATSQELEKEYWKGYEDAMQRRDVMPVKHGKWIDCRVDSEACSICKTRFYISALLAINRGEEPDYCPNCGARMDGDT